MGHILPTVEMLISPKDCGKLGRGRPEEEPWWEKGPPRRPLSYIREITTPCTGPDAGLGMTEPCSPFLATESSQLLLSDLVQIVLIVSYSQEKNIKMGLTMFLKTKETEVRQAKNGNGNY